jgi:exopolysaccharide biosynthesis polyprenyl glycosylphosphotransferase
MLWSRALAPAAADAVAPAPEQTQRPLFAAAVCLLLITDAALVTAAFGVAYAMRFGAAPEAVAVSPLDSYLRTGLTVGTVAAALLALQGLADLEHGRSWPVRLRAITSAISTGTVVTVLFSFDGDLRPSRAWLALSWSLAIAGLVVWRTFAPGVYLRIRRRLVTRPRAVVVGANALGREIARELDARFEVIGYVDNGTDLDGALDRPLLAAIADLGSIVRSRGVDEIVVTLPPDRREQLSRVITRGFGREVEVKILPEFGEHLPRRLEFGRFGSRPYIGYAPVARVTWIKRAIDICLGGLALLVLAPALAVIVVAIKTSSPGPVMYRQLRVGRDGKRFEMLKFRSMCAGADAMVDALRDRNEAIGPLFKIRRDPRVTPVGRFLRRFSLDELPQLINVLRGDMSLVGPRPPIPAEVDEYEEWQLGRLQARPGMTGLWQVSGRSEVPFNDMVRLDLHYVRNWSFGLDLEIMLRTIPAVVANRGAY